MDLNGFVLLEKEGYSANAEVIFTRTLAPSVGLRIYAKILESDISLSLCLG